MMENYTSFIKLVFNQGILRYTNYALVMNNNLFYHLKL
jgi:hypothetical protein